MKNKNLLERRPQLIKGASRCLLSQKNRSTGFYEVNFSEKMSKHLTFSKKYFYNDLYGHAEFKIKK